MLACKLPAVTCGNSSYLINLQILVFKIVYRTYTKTFFCYFCRGTFRMEREDGFAFDCRIPPFSLESKSDENPTPNAES